MLREFSNRYADIFSKQKTEIGRGNFSSLR